MALKAKNSPFGEFSIGSLELKSNLIAAPMAGLSSLPYRILALEQGAGLVMSEMVSVEGAIRSHERTHRYFENDDRARPFGIQLFGTDPKTMNWAICMLENEPADLIDINMGCPVKKVCSKGAGAAMMKTPRRTAEVIRSARNSTERPFTIKIRAGWDEESINCVEMAHIAESEGVDAVIIHPRTRSQMFSGKADWSLIARIKDAVKIPVVGNGDVKCRADALRMLDETGCDAVMIGRAAVGNPWIFRMIMDENATPPTSKEKAITIAEHMDLLRDFVGDHYAVLSMRQILPWYVKGSANVKAFLRVAQGISSFDELKESVTSFLSLDSTDSEGR
jgi:tRNA-dihydrouridine synthase B